MIPIPEAGQLRAVDGVAAVAAVPGVEGVVISVALHHAVPPARRRVLSRFYFCSRETPAAVEVALREAHGKLRFTIVPEIDLSFAP